MYGESRSGSDENSSLEPARRRSEDLMHVQEGSAETQSKLTELSPLIERDSDTDISNDPRGNRKNIKLQSNAMNVLRIKNSGQSAALPGQKRRVAKKNSNIFT